MKLLKEEFDDLRQSKSQFLLVLDGLDEVLCTHLFSRDSYLSKKILEHCNIFAQLSRNSDHPFSDCLSVCLPVCKLLTCQLFYPSSEPFGKFQIICVPHK